MQHPASNGWRLRLKLGLDLLSFIGSYYKGKDQQEIRNILCLTGGQVNAQATTCEDYMEEVWPNYGLQIINTLQGALESMPRSSTLDTDRCKVLFLFNFRPFWLRNLTSTVNMTCTVGRLWVVFDITSSDRDQIIQTIAQITWLGAALQESPHPKAPMAYVSANIQNHPAEPSRSDDDETSETRLVFSIIYHFKIPTRANEQLHAQGCCWYSLFQKPVIVQDFPIAKRDHNERGLEISLPVMADLGRADYWTEFGGTSVLKGFSTMFALVKYTGDHSRVWHFFYSPSRGRISYTKALVRGKSDVLAKCSLLKSPWQVSQDMTARNFVGWTTSVRGLTGRLRRWHIVLSSHLLARSY